MDRNRVVSAEAPDFYGYTAVRGDSNYGHGGQRPRPVRNHHGQSVRHGFKNVVGQSYPLAVEIPDRVRCIAVVRGLPESRVVEEDVDWGLNA